MIDALEYDMRGPFQWETILVRTLELRLKENLGLLCSFLCVSVDAEHL